MARDGSPEPDAPIDPHAVVIIGAGRAGRAMAKAFAVGGLQVTLIGRGDRLDGRRLQHADVLIVAVRDTQLDAVLRDMATWSLAPHAVVLHLSGNTDPKAALDVVRGRGHAVGTFHPLAALADAERAVGQLRHAWIGIDGDEEAQRVSRVLAQRIGARVLVIPPGNKPLYHAAAVIASNFPVVLAALAGRVMRKAGVPAEAASSAVASLMRGSIENIEHLGVGAALTGPAVRGDTATIQAHLAALSDDPDAVQAYQALTKLARG